MAAQKYFRVIGEVNSTAALEQLFSIHLSYDTARVQSLVNAFHRYTPASLLYIPEEYFDRFLVEMSPDTVLVYNAGADLRDVRASFHGSSLPFFYPTKRAVVETEYLQPWEPDGLSDFFKPFVPEWFLEEFVELFAGYTRYDFFESLQREMMDQVVVAEKKYSKALKSKLRDMREVQMRVKDLKWIILAVCTSPREEDGCLLAIREELRRQLINRNRTQRIENIRWWNNITGPPGKPRRLWG